MDSEATPGTSTTNRALDGGPKCHLYFFKWQCPLPLFLLVPCRLKNSPMSPVDFKKWQCTLSLFYEIPYRYFFFFKDIQVSPVDFKKKSCHPDGFKDQGPHKVKRRRYRTRAGDCGTVAGEPPGGQQSSHVTGWDARRIRR